MISEWNFPRILRGFRGKNALGKMANLFVWLKVLNQSLESKWRIVIM